MTPFCDWETDKFGFLDKDGKEAISPKYGLVRRFSSGTAEVFFGDRGTGSSAYKGVGKWIHIDKKGNEVTLSKNDDCDSNKIGYTSYNMDTGKWGLKDRADNEIIPCKYDYMRCFRNSLAAVEIDGKWGFIDRYGNEVVPCKYGQVKDYSEGFAAVNLNDGGWNSLWGFVDVNGSEIIPCIFREAEGFAEGFARVIIRDEIKFDKKGERGFIKLM